MSVIVCGTPKNEYGQFYCPICGFKDKNLEMFAIGMCWNCVFSEDTEDILEEKPKEENSMTSFGDLMKTDLPKDPKNVQLTELKPGDKVKFSYTDVVSSVNESTGHARTQKGARIRMTQGQGWDRVGPEATIYSAELVERKPAEPAFWPPKPGEVWRAGEGKEYMIINGLGSEIRAFDKDDHYYSQSDLKTKPGIRRVYKPGQ